MEHGRPWYTRAVAPDRKTFFSRVAQSTLDTSAGLCPMPIFYTDASLLGFIYLIDPARARALLEESPFEPLLFFGKAMVQLVTFEYRESSIGAYNELALALEVKLRGRNTSPLRALLAPRRGDDHGSHILNLPVTTESACAAGKELWGFPKYVTGIETEFRARAVRATLEGELEIDCGAPGFVRTPGPPLVTISVHEGRVLRTLVETDHLLSWGGSATIRIVGKGPTADNVERLGLESQKPFLVFRTLRMRSILPLGTDVGGA